jgi:hypothetical protein
MTDTALDRYRDLMVAALYDELPAAERSELEGVLAGNDELRREWQELHEARTLLSSLAASEQDLPPRFALPDTPAVRTISTHSSAWRPALASAAGFLIAVLGFSGLLIAGLRIDRTTDGWLIGFGRRATTQREIPTNLRLANADGDEFLTKNEFMTVARRLVDVTAARFDDLERRQSEAQTETARVLFRALASRQQVHFDDLRYRLDRAVVRTGAKPVQTTDTAAIPAPRN